MQRIWVLNWNNITYDKDFWVPLFALLNAGVVSGFGVSGSWASAEIEAWKALIECTRNNGDKIMVAFENTANVAIDMSGTKKVYILVDQDAIDDGQDNAEDGTWVASIQTGASYPAGNYVPLYSIASDVVTNDMTFASLNTTTLSKSDLTQLIQNITTTGNVTANTFFGDWSNLTGLVAEVQSTSLNKMLWTAWEIGKAYSLVDYNQTIWGTSNDFWSTAQPEVAQSFFAQDVDISEIILKIKTISSPSDNVFVEIQTDNAGVPSGTVVANGTSNNVPYTSLTGTFAEVTFSFASVPDLTAETKYHIVVKRTGSTDAVNYYAVESAWSDVQIGTMSKNTWSWSNATDDLYFKLPTAYKLAKLWWSNLLWICQATWSIGEIVKFNKDYDNHQSWLITWNWYWYDIYSGVLSAGWNFKAISETEIVFGVFYEDNDWNSIFWDWSDWDLVITSWNTVNLNLWQVYNYNSIDVQSGGTLSTTWSDGTMILKCKTTFNIDWNIDLKWKWNDGAISVVEWWISATPWSGWTAWDWWAGWTYWVAIGWSWWTWWSWYGGGWGWGWWNNVEDRGGWDGWDWGYPWGLWWLKWQPWNPWGTSAGWGGWWYTTRWWDWWDAYWQNWDTATDTTFWGGWGWAGWELWSSWWNIIIYVKELSWSWSIDCSWWTGWDGWNGWLGWRWWGGWGWGWAWWGGWCIWIIKQSESWSITKNVSWWSGWTGWSAWGSNTSVDPWNPWTDWTSWTDWQVSENI